VAVILIVVMIIALFYVVPLKRAHLLVDLKSNDPSQSMSYTLRVDGALLAAGILAPEQILRVDWEANWTYAQGDCLSHSVRGVADAAGTPQVRMADVMLCEGDRELVEFDF